jgi:hypothetical protein
MGVGTLRLRHSVNIADDTDITYIADMSKTHPAPVRKIINLPEDLAREISEFQHTHRLPSENEAIRRLLRFALEKSQDDNASHSHDERSV